MARVVTRVEDAWNRGNFAALLLMDVKDAFDHVNRNSLSRQMHKMGADSDIVRWVALFLTDRRIQSVIDSSFRKEIEIETGVPQGSLVSPTFFNIYLCDVF